MRETAIRNVEACPRCGQDHEDLETERLDNPPEWFGWWSTCPTTGQPVLTEVLAEDAEQQTFADARAEALEKAIDEARTASANLALAAREGLAGPAKPGEIRDLDAALASAREEAAGLRERVTTTNGGGEG